MQGVAVGGGNALGRTDDPGSVFVNEWGYCRCPKYFEGVRLVTTGHSEHTAPAKQTLKVLILARYGNKGASSRMRMMQFVPWYEQAGVACTVQSLLADEQLDKFYATGAYRLMDMVAVYWRRVRVLLQRHEFDLVLIEKEGLPWLPAWFERWLLSGVPYVLDFDDAIFHNYDRHSSAWVRRVFGRKIDRLMAGSAMVVAGNDYIADRARTAGAPWVEVVPTVIDLERYAVRPNTTVPTDQFVVGWIGSPSTAKYLQMLASSLEKLSALFPLRLRAIGGGGVRSPGVEVENLPWSELDEVSMLQDCDIGVMPLADTPWERGKCGFKLIQYMACGKPVVASPVGINREIVVEGVNGFLASTPKEWFEALLRLKADPVLRRSMGEQGRRMVEEKYCLQVTAPRLHRILLESAGRA
jgi:glycosyltransferase involved in cell wall biosynthesis